MQSIPFNEMGRARSGAVSAKGIKFSAYANAMPATKEVAPFLGRAKANGVEEQEELVLVDVVIRFVQEDLMVEDTVTSIMVAEELQILGILVLNLQMMT